MSSGDQYIEQVKERLAATTVFNLTGDEYMKTIDEIFGNNIYKELENFGNEIQKIRPQNDEAFYNQIKTFQSYFDNELCSQLDSYEAYIAKSIFRVPNHVSIEQDTKIEQAMKDFSEEEDRSLDKQIEETKMRINQKRLYFKLLRDQASMIECVKQACSKTK